MQSHQHVDDSTAMTDANRSPCKGNGNAGDIGYSLQSLIDCLPDYLWVKDAESRFIIANRAIASDCGMGSPRNMIGITDFDLHEPDVARYFQDVEKTLISTGQSVIDLEESVVDNAGTTKWFLTNKVPLRDATGAITGLIGISRDITQRKLADILRDGQARIVEAIATGASLAAILDQLARLVECQTAGLVASLFLLDDHGMHLRRGGAPSMADQLLQVIESVPVDSATSFCGLAASRREAVIVTDTRLDPLFEARRGLVESLGYRSCWSFPIPSQHGGVLGVLTICGSSARVPSPAESRLIDFILRIAAIAIERQRAEDRIQFMASHDALTKLPNRSVLKDRLTQALLHAHQRDRWVSVVFVDLDNFKFVNDSLGHRAGDDLLRQIADKIVSSIRSVDTVLRFGGDEFVIILSDQPKENETVSATIQKVRIAIQEACQLGAHSVSVTSSMGVANYPDDGTDADTLLANADAAMYRAKDSGRDNLQFFTPDLNARAHENLQIQEALRHAIARSEFTLHYQPQVDLRTGQILAVEALLRWRHPVLGMVAPCKFIPLAEQTGSIVPIGEWVLHEACRQNKAWHDAGLPCVIVSVNVSARQFRDKTLVSRVRSALEDSGLEPKYLELELTESLIMQDVERAVATMDQFRALGVSLSIDDFGTGYSSLSALKTFPVARLKIDKSFIADLTTNASDRAVAGAVISLGQKLNLRVIAEGVETSEQADFLRENHCDEMQGFHFSRPLPADDCADILRRSKMLARLAMPDAVEKPIRDGHFTPETASKQLGASCVLKQ